MTEEVSVQVVSVRGSVISEDMQGKACFDERRAAKNKWDKWHKDNFETISEKSKDKYSLNKNQN